MLPTMPITEIDTFVRKFHQLWNAGLNAHLDLDCHAGVAYVGLRLQLGHAPGPPHYESQPQQNPRKYYSPSYQRRRERRSAARERMNESNKNAEEASTVVSDIIDTHDMRKSKQFRNDESIETVAVAVEATKESDNLQEELTAENETEKNDINNVEELTDHGEASLNNKEIDGENDEEEPCTVAVCEENTCAQEPVADVVPVYCTATVENCPDAELTEEYGHSIRRLIVNEQHLVQNIISTELHYVSSRSFRNNLHTHTVSVILYVKTARLWENPASYVRKHLGLSNYWERSNGTVVRLSRIHQK